MADGAIHKAIPRRVLEAIKRAVREGSHKGESAWKAASKDEDTITGHWGGSVAKEWSDPIHSEGYEWRFRIDYRKFSGSSEEPETGADGIFQIEVDRYDIAVTPSGRSVCTLEVVETAASFKKGMLFQAKKHDNTKRKEMLSQLASLEGLTPNEGAYFEYGPAAFRAASAAAVRAVDGFTGKLEPSDFPRLGDFLADQFLECRRGVAGMYFDFEEQLLTFPTENGQIARLRTALKHGFRVRVTAFRLIPFTRDIERVNWELDGF